MPSLSIEGEYVAPGIRTSSTGEEDYVQLAIICHFPAQDTYVPWPTIPSFTVQDEHPQHPVIPSLDVDEEYVETGRNSEIVESTNNTAANSAVERRKPKTKSSSSFEERTPTTEGSNLLVQDICEVDHNTIGGQSVIVSPEKVCKKDSQGIGDEGHPPLSESGHLSSRKISSENNQQKVRHCRIIKCYSITTMIMLIATLATVGAVLHITYHSERSKGGNYFSSYFVESFKPIIVE